MLNHLVRHLHHSIAELQGIHEECKLGYFGDIIWCNAMPVNGTDVNAIREA